MYGQLMKKINNIYDDIIDIKKIQFMYNRKVKINTKNKGKLEKFENNYVSNMVYDSNCYEVADGNGKTLIDNLSLSQLCQLAEML